MHSRPARRFVALSLCDERICRRLSSGRMHLGESDSAARSARWTGTIAMSPLRWRAARRQDDKSDRWDACSRTLESGRREKSAAGAADSCLHANAAASRAIRLSRMHKPRRPSSRTPSACASTACRTSPTRSLPRAVKESVTTYRPEALRTRLRGSSEQVGNAGAWGHRSRCECSCKRRLEHGGTPFADSGADEEACRVGAMRRQRPPHGLRVCCRLGVVDALGIGR
jgi:hypothetical protein